MGVETHSLGCAELSEMLRILADKIESSKVSSEGKISIQSLLTVKEVEETPASDFAKVLGSAKDVLVQFEETYFTDYYPLNNMETKEDDEEEVKAIVSIKKLNFSYSGNKEILRDVDLKIMPKQRIFLVGLNGSGKSSLLRCLSGGHIASFEEFELEDVKSSNSIACSLPWSDQFRGLAYLGSVFKRAGTRPAWEAYSRDVAVRDMMKHWQEANPERRDVLVKVLGINLDWRMHQVSDGQRKKVRIMLKLLKPFRLCVVDEFAAELDILARKRFFDYLTRECEERGAAVIYATHIFDIPAWATHIAFMKEKTLSPLYNLSTYEPYQRLVKAQIPFPLYRIVIRFMLEQNPYGLDVGDVNEAEEMQERDFNPFDSGFESGRSQLTEASTLLTMQEAINAKKAKTGL